VLVVALVGREDRHDEVLDRAVAWLGADVEARQRRRRQDAARMEVAPDRCLLLAEPTLELVRLRLRDVQDDRDRLHACLPCVPSPPAGILLPTPEGR
jgi:hypothetical protein